MLVLKRKPKQTVTIVIPASTETRTVQVCLTKIDKNSVRMGFRGPPDVQFVRNEIAHNHLRCPVCGYTTADAKQHGDHQLCKSYPFFEFEKE